MFYLLINIYIKILIKIYIKIRLYKLIIFLSLISIICYQRPVRIFGGLLRLIKIEIVFLNLQLWCEVADPEMLEKKVRRDPHSLAPLRVIGSVSNSEDFAKTFNCPEGSPMNPKKKCNIWK